MLWYVHARARTYFIIIIILLSLLSHIDAANDTFLLILPYYLDYCHKTQAEHAKYLGLYLVD